MSLYDLLFEIEMILCESFENLNPLAVNEYKAVDVFIMIRDLNVYNDRKIKQNGNEIKKAVDTTTKRTRVLVTD